ncbi:hypothetical protein UFOVP736_58 [uncultured Caudovirales phage]|uniref:Uncharacterized protein n=1 Tax=uncultured Caudovirales phage TaxID=2100421 RepID=A0A6J7X1K1_9CAUD|nr:hypothetical protein UFOVP705_23 [uncultured Caudovirales phage]CAB5224340.1 hypothetical protein UFOVP736_58 [uncultured Caudovirales phage]
MSYANTDCPCGEKKERETMICATCQQTFADTFEMKVSLDLTETWEARRSSAIQLLAMCRRRNKRLPLTFTM